MKVFIIEDEQPAVERLEKLLHEVEADIHIMGTADSIKSSVKWLKENPQPDLILLDIELADGQSFDIFKKVDVQSFIIFTTSYDEYALQAFRLNSIDYLLKPIKKEDLKKSIEKYKQLKKTFSGDAPAFNVEELLTTLTQQLPKTTRRRFLVKQGQKLVSVDVTDIAYFFAEGRLSYFKTWDKAKYIVDYTIDELSDMLDPEIFFRASRAFIINIRSVAQIHSYFNGKLKLELKPASEKEVVISKERARDFKDWMGK